MAVQAQRLVQAFPHGFHATAGGALFLDEPLGELCAPLAVAGIGSAVRGYVPRSVLTTCCNGDSGDYGVVPRNRARVAGGLVEDPRVVLAVAAPQGLFAVGDVVGRAAASGAASPSGRMDGAAGLSQGLLSQFYHHGVEIDVLVRLEVERMRAGLEEAQRRHVLALALAAAAAGRSATGTLKAAEAELKRARCRNAELEEKFRQMSAEGQAWMGVAKSHEAVAAGLRATLDQVLQSSCAVAIAAGDGDAEDALSCYFETAADAIAGADDALSKAGGGDILQNLPPQRGLRAAAPVPPPVPVPGVRGRRRHLPRVRGHQECLAPCPALLKPCSGGRTLQLRPSSSKTV
ncbi:hypothetical protein GUJ93_ZPchr0004g39813 [Zizania palustris]|uniref:Uncharacterized protein n=1 Tax=Zizania palustris TaxID=103762 RepID=A0A8J5S578_ZIZPA|nr:hypothetical protein GUJ93_ZPchr0004g39813 [Zizania palustris]